MSLAKIKIIDSYENDSIEDLILCTNKGEQKFLLMIKNGQYQEIENVFKNTNVSLIVGKMSNDTIRQLRYMAVSGVTLFSRAAIAGGLFQIESLSLSDAFIQKIDTLVSPDQIIEEIFKVMIDYAYKVHFSKLRTVKTPIVLRSANFIHTNVTKKLSSKIVAQEVNCTEQYLGKLFKKELNCTISDFILREKIDKAIELIKVGDVPLNEVPYSLGFCSQSHFIQCFKKITGLTPVAYKNKYSQNLLK